MRAGALLILLAAYELWAEASDNLTLTDLSSRQSLVRVGLFAAMGYMAAHLLNPQRFP